MRIGFFTSIDGWGGSETYLKSIITGVRDAGHSAVLFGISGSRLYGEIEAEHIPVVAWNGIERSGNGSAGPEITEKTGGVARETKAIAIAAVVPPGIRLLAGNLREAMRLYRLFRKHRTDVMHVAVNGYEVAGIASRLAGMPSLAMNMVSPPYERNRVRRWLMTWTMRQYTHVSSQSEYCTTEWIRIAGLKKEMCSHVWSSADVSRFTPDPHRLDRKPSDPFRMLSIGRLHEMKGHEYAIRALGDLRDSRLSLDIAGEGPQRAALETLISRLELGNQVRLLGHVENAETLMHSADCFVLASVSHESCPAVLAEAMASGLPLITSDFGPLPEVNQHGVTGLVARASNQEALASVITRLADAPSVASEMGRAGRARAMSVFSRDMMIQKTISLYNGLVAA